MADEQKQGQSNEVVTEKAVSRISDLWKKEDYWAIWLGFALLLLAMIIYFPRGPEGMEGKIAAANATIEREAQRGAPFKTVATYQAEDAKKKLKATSSKAGKSVKKFTSKPHGWKTNPLDAFFMGSEQAKAKTAKGSAKYTKAANADKAALANAKSAEAAAARAGFKNEALNVFFVALGDTVNAFKGSVAGQAIDLSTNKEGALCDADSRTTWDARGKYRSGPLRSNLEIVAISDEYWFSWKAFHPDSTLVRLP